MNTFTNTQTRPQGLKFFSRPQFMQDFNRKKMHLRHVPPAMMHDASRPDMNLLKQEKWRLNPSRRTTTHFQPKTTTKFFSQPQFIQDFNRKKMGLRHLPPSMMHDASRPDMNLLKQERWRLTPSYRTTSYRPTSFHPTTTKFFSRPEFMQEFNRKKLHLRHVPPSMMRDASSPNMLLLKQEKWQSQWMPGTQGAFKSTGLGAGRAVELHETLQRPTVLKEKIIPIEEESIQPVIHREVQKREIHEIVQPIHERKVLPATIEERQLPAELRQFGHVQHRVPIVEPSTIETAPTARSKIVNAPIIQETVRKTVIEEVQPVVHRDTVRTHIINETLPIYEKIIEPEVVIKEVRPVLEHALQAPAVAPTLTQQTGFGQKYAFDIEQKTTLQPQPGTTTTSKFGHPLHK